MLLVLASFADDLAEQICLREADDMLTKPMTSLRIEMTLRNLMRLRHLERELQSHRVKQAQSG